MESSSYEYLTGYDNSHLYYDNMMQLGISRFMEDLSTHLIKHEIPVLNSERDSLLGNFNKLGNPC